MKKSIVVAMAAAAFITIHTSSVDADAAGQSTTSNVQIVETTNSKVTEARWVYRNGKYYFYNTQGKKQIGWVRYKGKRYYTDKTGARVTGWMKINGHRYYFSKSKGGEMLRGGLFKMGKNYYYFETNGHAYHGWRTINGKTYYFNYKGKRMTGLREIGSATYYFDSKGVRKTGWRTISGKKYYFDKKTGKMLTGLQKISGKTYYFDSDGIRRTGWQTIDGDKYFFNTKTARMATGLVTISKKKYFFNDDGTLLKNNTVTVNGVTYDSDSKGICTVAEADGSAQTRGNEQDILFFTHFESGADAYRQAGGDNGNACGKYQFDYRYSLLPFVKYCYEKDPITFASFKTYANLSLTKKSKLQGNTKFFKAWQSIYDQYPETFKKYQDDYAKMEYYDVTERYLLNYGIDIRERPYVVQGAVFSYSIQHGQYTAAQAVLAAGIEKEMSDTEFLNKLYDYRIKKFPLYTPRYTQERMLALSILNTYL